MNYFILSRIYFIVVSLVVMITGLIYLFLQLSETAEKSSFTKEFIDKFRQYLQSHGKDDVAYGWMIFHSTKMQKDLGIVGVAIGYKPPGASYLINNYQIIINMLPELHGRLNDPLSSITSGVASGFAQTLEEVLIRHMGVLYEKSEILRSHLKNPIIYFREGILVILLVPFYFISWLGILSTNKIHSLADKLIMKFLSGVLSLITILSSIVGLVVGWPGFLKIIKHYVAILLNKL